MTITKVLLGLATWALLAGLGLAFTRGASITRQRVEGGRPEDAS